MHQIALCTFYVLILILQMTHYSLAECTNFYTILEMEPPGWIYTKKLSDVLSMGYPFNTTEEYSILQKNLDCILELDCDGNIITECTNPIHVVTLKSRDAFIPPDVTAKNGKMVQLPESSTTTISPTVSIAVSQENNTSAAPTIDPENNTEIMSTIDSENNTKVMRTIDQENNTEVTRTIDPENNSEVTPTIDPENNTEVTRTIDSENNSEVTPTIDSENNTEVTQTIDPENNSEVTPTIDPENNTAVTAIENPKNKTEVIVKNPQKKTEIMPRADPKKNITVDPENSTTVKAVIDLGTETYPNTTIYSTTDPLTTEMTTKRQNETSSYDAEYLIEMEKKKNQMKIAAIVVGGLLGGSLFAFLARKVLNAVQSGTYRFPDPAVADTGV